ncbi:callose synthase 12 [Eucalyptus grandis]|uniref:callose synthase 12 n=1 Tax=Eucalyptus grandis TaxID=71139 RepID=UPI00192ECF77|nr:callose synthase 12 [Eucalyptus grandis]
MTDSQSRTTELPRRNPDPMSHLRSPNIPGNLRGRSWPGQTLPGGDDQEPPYNIIPVAAVPADHPSLRVLEVRAACAALRSVGDLRWPPWSPWRPDYDLLDWLRLFFGFQEDNVRNQREHLVLHLANLQMRLASRPDNIEVLDVAVLCCFRKKLLRNYTLWCSYLGRKSNIWISDCHDVISDPRRELLYVSLYLLVWGESANLRLMPECICYIFHNLAMEMNRILENYIDPNTGQPVLPSVSGEKAFLKEVVKPIYDTIRKEVNRSKNGTAPPGAWSNYDDINEYFWSGRCFAKLRWPIDSGSSFSTRDGNRYRVGKMGFVETRTFLNLFRSFDRLWVMLVLFLQAAIIVAWHDDKEYPWQALKSRDLQVKVLTIFMTWSGMRFLQSLLDAGTQYLLVSRETMFLGVRMVMKIVVASLWMIAFWVFYGRIWSQRNADERWSQEANRRLVHFLELAFVFDLPELLGLTLMIIPWIQNFLEERNWRIFHLFTWWFQSRIFVGRGLREGLVDSVKYSLFWIHVLATKFLFSYFLQIKPMIQPTKQLLKLVDVKYEWHQFFGDSNRFAVGLLWLPVVLIYLMDLQIWYSIYSSLVGAAVGLLDHLGEIRNLEQVRLRFQFFASAVQFNLMPEGQLLQTIGNKFKDLLHRLKLRYGLGTPYQKFEPNQIEALRFALLWNEIIAIFREEDIVSDQEVELLELRRSAWSDRVISWPCFLLFNELLLALRQAKELVDATDKRLWYKICKNEYRRCAVIEAYDSVKHLLLEIVKIDSKEHSVITDLFEKIDRSIEDGKFTKQFNLSMLPEIHKHISKLAKLLKDSKKDVGKIVLALQALYRIVIREFSIDGEDQLASGGRLPFMDAVELPDPSNSQFHWQVRRLHIILTSRDSTHNVPSNVEARRRICFFSNSLFMNMPHAPKVEKMFGFSVLTPYHNEEVLYSKEQLLKKNEDGVCILFYLKTVYPDEWKYFIERMLREGKVVKADEDDETMAKLRDLRLWASYRGLTLARAVRGMMYYHRALKVMAFLDSASEVQIQELAKRLDSGGQDGSTNSSRLEELSSSLSFNTSISSTNLSLEDHISAMKCTFVVACQIYGSQKAEKDNRAEEILSLMKNNEALRVAYVEEVPAGRDEKDEKEYYSVLVKYDGQRQKEVELYRVQLPGPLKLGEGKSENQNHALIFTRGDAVQTIDMNQDNYFEEALKIRNLLEEFKTYYGIRKPTVLGVREHIFTGSVSSLAWFMSAQEMSLVTLGQRVLASPLKVRMNYSHSDVFDRFWFLSRGGISRASRIINISEDISAGFNCTLRGGKVTHHEYIQVGKGRDVGLNQISMVEAKVAAGNGEQVLSRDVYRLGHRLDFFRMLSFFYTTVGYFFNTTMVILTAYAFLWGRLYLCPAASSSNDNKALGTILNLFVIQLCLFTAIPMIVESTLQHGFLQAMWDFMTKQLQLSSVFYTFSMGTRAHYFGRTILHGSAKYRPTGHGFVVDHKSFAENYRLYARSHFVKAIELGVLLTFYASRSHADKNTFTYKALTISSWFLVASWIMAPFLFNPLGFDWLKTVHDFDDFMNWIWFRAGVFTKAEESWEVWWYEEQDHLRTTGLWGKLVEVILDLRFFLFQYGVVYQLGIPAGSRSISVYLLSLICFFVILGVHALISYAWDKYAAREHMYYRLVQFLIIILGALALVALVEYRQLKVKEICTSLLAFIPTGWGLISIAQVLRPILKPTWIWGRVVSLARLYDIMFGVIVMAPIAVFSWMPGSMQTRILFNQAFSEGLWISRIVSAKRPKVHL